MSGPLPAERSAVSNVSYWAASYSFSCTVTFGCRAWKPSASVLNSGVVDRLQPDIVIVTLPVGKGPAAGVSLSVPQPASANEAATVTLRAARIERLIHTPSWGWALDQGLRFLGDYGAAGP